MFGVGIIGCGAISRMHANSFREIRGVELKAVADVNLENAVRMAGEYGAEAYSDYREMLKREDIHAVSICTPSGMHEAAAIHAAEARKHVIVEKPMEIKIDKINRMIAACEKNGVKLAGIFNNRYREGNVFVKNAIERGRFGRLINVNAYIRWYREPDYYLKSSWRGTWAYDGGGALMNQSIHYIDLLLWFAGRVESVCAYTGTLLHKTIETEDTAAAVLKFKSGALGAIIAGTSIYPGFPGKIEITGERGSAALSDGVIETWQFRDREDMDEEAVHYMNCPVDNKRASDPVAFDHFYHKKQIEQIIDDFKNCREPEVNGQEARKSVELILAIYESSKKNESVILS